MRRSSSCTAAAALLTMLAGVPASAQSGLSGDWRVDLIDGKSPIAGSKIFMRFDATGRISGMASCNRFGAAFTVDGEKISIGPAMATRMACRPEIMAQEQRFLNLLQGAASWRIESARLTITSGEGGAIEASATKL